MKTILHLVVILLVAVIVAGGVYALVENTTLVSSAESEHGGTARHDKCRRLHHADDGTSLKAAENTKHPFLFSQRFHSFFLGSSQGENLEWGCNKKQVLIRRKAMSLKFKRYYPIILLLVAFLAFLVFRDGRSICHFLHAEQ
jgi:hypothetical protein